MIKGTTSNHERVNTCSKNVICEVGIPFVIISLFSMAISYICIIHDADKNEFGLQTKSIIISVWSLILLIYNIMEGIIVKCSKYYTISSTRKSYIITSLILLGHMIAIWSSPVVAALLQFVPMIYLYEFVGIRHFHSIKWVFGIKSSSSCDFKGSFLLLRISFFIKYAMYIFVILVFGILPRDINISNDIKSYMMLLNTIFSVFLVMSTVIMFPASLFMLFSSFTKYTKSLTSLMQSQHVQNTLDDQVKIVKLARNKLWITKIYFFFLPIVIIASIPGINIWTVPHDSPNKLKYQFMNTIICNAIFLHLWTLMLYFERPSLQKYSKCAQCSSDYLQSEHCQICGSQQNEQTYHGNLNTSSQSGMQSIVMTQQSLSNQSVNTSFNRMNEKCDSIHLQGCPSFVKISALSKSVNDQSLQRQNNMNPLSILNDFIHVIQRHDVNMINECVDECKCDEYQYHKRSQRTRYSINSEQYIDKLIGNIHCYLYHNIQRRSLSLSSISEDAKYDDDDDIDIAFKDNNSEHFQDENDSDSLLYGFGSFIYYNLLKPKYNSFKTEMINYITIKEWNSIYQEAHNLLISDFAKTLISKNNHNNILKLQGIQIGDILSIKFYTDLDNEQYEFRKSFRKTSKNDTNKDIITRHINKYYFWGKWLNHAITVYGDRLNNNENITYYHGLSGKFIFSSFRKDFNIPTSVTTSLISANNFAGYNGIILQLKCQWQYKSKWNLSSALSVEWMSSFPDEKEVLLFGNFNQLIINNIYFVDDIDNNNIHKLIIETMNNFEQLCDGYSLDVIYDDEKHANTMKILIENEIKGNWKNAYFVLIFHNICINRKHFVSAAWMMYLRKWRHIINAFCQSSNAYIMYSDKCDHDAKLRRVYDTARYNKCKECKVEKTWCECTEIPSHFRLCSNCYNGKLMLPQILINAKRVTQIDKLDDVKINALRIESLQRKKLF